MPTTDFHPTSARFARLGPRTLVGPRSLRLIRTLTALQRNKTPAGVEVLTLGSGVGVRLHRPIGVNQPAPALLWIHGGGYVLGSPQQDDLAYPMLENRSGTGPEKSQLPIVEPEKQPLRLGRLPGNADPQVAVPARRDDLSGLAPAWIGVGTHDLFQGERRLRRAPDRGRGVVLLEVVSGLSTVSTWWYRKPQCRRQFFASQCTELRTALAGDRLIGGYARRRARVDA